MDAVHARYLLIKSGTAGIDSLADKILFGLSQINKSNAAELAVVTTLPPEEVEENTRLALCYLKARGIYLSDTKRVYVEACLIASNNFTEINDIIGVPVDVISLYRDVFFNITDFDKLSMLELIESCRDESEKSMKIWALSQGLTFISWRLGKIVQTNPVDGLQELFTLCIYRGKEAMFSSNDGKNNQDATRWIKQATELARILKSWVMDSDAARKDIELALSSVIPDFQGFNDLD